MRRRARRVRATTYGLAAVIGLGSAVGAIAAGLAVYDGVRTDDRRVNATTSAQAEVRPRDLPGDRVRWSAPIEWADEAGRTHRGTVDVAFQMPAGSVVPAGLAANGTLRAEPVAGSEAGLRGLLTAAAVAAGGALLIRGIVPAGRRNAERALVQSWDSAWADWNATPRPSEH